MKPENIRGNCFKIDGMNVEIENIVFDFGGVLIDLDFERLLNAFKKIGFNDIETQLKTYERDGIFQKYELGEMTADEFRMAIRGKSNVILTDSDIDDLWNLMLVHIPSEKLDFILNLRNNYNVYLLSNTNSIHWEYACKNSFCYKEYNIKDFFIKTFLSYEMHLAKPDKAIYESMLNQAKLIPEKTLFIDDSLANCNVAKQLGINVHHYQIGENLETVLT